MSIKNYECDGQLSIFDFIKPECNFSGHTCNKQNLWEVADTLDALQCPHVCCRKCNTRGCGARCNGSEEPEPKKAFEAGDHVEEHGARVMFEELQVNHYYIADYSTESHKWFRVVFVKWIKDDAVGFVDSPKGIKGKWSWGTKYSALSRKMYINAERNSAIGEADTSGWFYELPGPKITDDYIRENPTCFYVFGHYLDRDQGWHKMPEELPNFVTWQLIDVVLFGKKTGTVWMEHEKWEAKDWAFRSVDNRGNSETTEILAWKLSDDKSLT